MYLMLKSICGGRCMVILPRKLTISQFNYLFYCNFHSLPQHLNAVTQMYKLANFLILLSRKDVYDSPSHSEHWYAQIVGQ